MSQGTRSAAEAREFKRMLANINFLYLGASVLILIDRTYMGRFWCAFEAWLSMQSASAAGLHSSPLSERRCVIECVHGAPETLRHAVAEEWAAATAEVAHAKLSAADVVVTHASDKLGQLAQIGRLDAAVRAIAASAEGADALSRRPAAERETGEAGEHAPPAGEPTQGGRSDAVETGSGVELRRLAAEMEDMRLRAERAEGEVVQQRKEIAELRTVNAELRARLDVELARWTAARPTPSHTSDAGAVAGGGADHGACHGVERPARGEMNGFV